MIINVTSRWASISGRTAFPLPAVTFNYPLRYFIGDTGKYISYRVPKATLYQFTMTIAEEMKEDQLKIMALLLDPGNVKTKLSHWQGELEVEESAQDVNQKVTVADSGKFLTWKGKEAPF
jgi:NAD(P)-dependent dehydrogenase (short-subunit alcohol dehydrogenase family)